ncbi:MAG: alpha-mannosidase [Bacillota bacterium]
MSFATEWRNRIDAWRNELKKHFYLELGKVELSGFTTTDFLTCDQAMARGDFMPMPPGTKWGAKWEYGWFKGTICLPEEARGKRIVLRTDVGAESAIYVNGKHAGARDWSHTEITLTPSGVPGKKYDILIEGYAGHGPLECHAGPTPPGRITVPEPPPAQAEVGKSGFGIWEEDVFQLWMDVETLFGLRELLDPNSLRLAEIDQALRDFTLIVDFEVPHGEMIETVKSCRKRLEPQMSCVNGSTAPLLFAFGHSHIDVAWLWPLAETERKCSRTFSSQLALMAEYPEYKFLQSQAHLYWMVKNRYPALYGQIKEAVRKGQFIPEGGMWVEADTNISGGESLIRQFIHGKRFFREEFGVECELLWLPDVFGYSGAMPQIMRGCGIKYFSTAKIFWNYHGGDPFPFNTFIWEGIDGSEILVHLCNDYNSQTAPAAVLDRWNGRVQKDGISTRLMPFGWGDGGGGPTRVHLEYLRRMRDLEGLPRVVQASPVDYFKDLEKRGMPGARYVGELYFQAHQGTYTSQARTKKGNRRSELALREAEMWGAAAAWLKNFRYPLDTIGESWKKVLLNQFHDIIPGSSIHRVYEEAEALHREVLDAANDAAGQARKELADGARALTIFNSLSWERKALLTLPQEFNGAADMRGQVLPLQKTNSGCVVEVAIPPCGWTTIYPEKESVPENKLKAAPNLLENEWLRLEFNDKGEITSIYDKETGREQTAGPCNSFRMYKDVPALFDAWDIDSMYRETPLELTETAQIDVIESGPLQARLRIKRKLNRSDLVQEVVMRRGSRRIDFISAIDWQESHKLLKVAFPVRIHANEGIHEIQFGHIRRPNHSSRQFDADRFEVSNHKWSALAEENRGFAVLNDCKYGLNITGQTISLTLLKSALAPDMTADKGMQEFTYAVYPWNGSLAESEVVREAYELNCPVSSVPGAAGEQWLFKIDPPNIVIETVKPAEDGSGDIVVRLYESKRTATRCILESSLPVREALINDMLEIGQQNLNWRDGKTVLEFRPFEIKTIRLKK